jgi:hypothetical protein
VSRTPRQKKGQKKKGASPRDRHDGAPLTVITNTTQHHGRQYDQQQDYSGHGGSKKNPPPTGTKSRDSGPRSFAKRSALSRCLCSRCARGRAGRPCYKPVRVVEQRCQLSSCARRTLSAGCPGGCEAAMAASSHRQAVAFDASAAATVQRPVSALVSCRPCW